MAINEGYDSKNDDVIVEPNLIVNDDPKTPVVPVEGKARFLTILCDPTTLAHRIVILIFMCMLGFGSYFCYDNVGALQNQITSDMRISTAKFASLYSWYSWPNVVLCFFGGFLIDRVFGIRLGAIIFSGFILVGQIIFALGAYVDSFTLMAAGRFVFGLGGESLAVAQNTYAVSWFKGKELNMVFGLQLSIARVGSTVNFDSMNHVYDWISNSYTGYQCLGLALFFAAITCVLSLVCALILGYFDRRAERLTNRSAGKTGEVVKITDAKDFSASFWLLTFICVSYYVAIFPYIGLGTVYFQRKWGFDLDSANQVDSIAYVVSAAVSPVLGFCVDKLGYNLSWVFVAIFTTLAAHMLLAFTFVTPWAGMVIMGVGYSLLACALWPMVALVIPERQLGTAYGVMQCVQNLGLGVVPLIAGAIIDVNGYLILSVFFQACVCCSLIGAVVLFLLNSKRDGMLNLSVSKRLSKEQEQL